MRIVSLIPSATEIVAALVPINLSAGLMSVTFPQVLKRCPFARRQSWIFRDQALTLINAFRNP